MYLCGWQTSLWCVCFYSSTENTSKDLPILSFTLKSVAEQNHLFSNCLSLIYAGVNVLHVWKLDLENSIPSSGEKRSI